MKVVIIDNYDSFTYNIVEALRQLDMEPMVIRNDKFEIEDIAEYDKIILSPGPGIPSEAGKLMQVLATYANKKSILGICLGHQAISEHFGAKLINMNKVKHGISTPINVIEEDYIFKSLPIMFMAGRYHSWIVDKEYLPKELIITAVDSDNNIMAIKHSKYDIHGVQFHPESIMTSEGIKILSNFINK